MKGSKWTEWTEQCPRVFVIHVLNDILQIPKKSDSLLVPRRSDLLFWNLHNLNFCDALLQIATWVNIPRSVCQFWTIPPLTWAAINCYCWTVHHPQPPQSLFDLLAASNRWVTSYLCFSSLLQRLRLRLRLLQGGFLRQVRRISDASGSLPPFNAVAVPLRPLCS